MKKVPTPKKAVPSSRSRFSPVPFPREMEQVYRLWEEMDRFPANDTDRALAYLARNIKTILKADDVRWMAAVRILRGSKAKRDVLLGWRIRCRYSLLPISEKYLKLVVSLLHREVQ